METRPEAGRAEDHAATLIDYLPNKRATLCAELHGGTMGKWWSSCREHFAHATVQSAYYQLRRSIALCVERGLLPRIPWDGEFKPPRAARPKPRILRTEEEIRTLVRQTVTYDDRQIQRGHYPGRAAFVVLLLGTAIRHSEALALGWDHCWLSESSEEGARISVEFQGPRDWRKRQARWKTARDPQRGRAFTVADDRPRIPTKNGLTRSIRLGPVPLAALRLHREQLERIGHYRPDGPVFPDRDGKWYENGVVMPPHHLAALCDAAGVPRVTVHQLRHTGLSHSMAANPDLANTAAFSGHSDMRVLLERYTHATGGQGLVPSVPLPSALPQSIAVAPKALPPARNEEETEDDRPDFAAEWARNPGPRPEAITRWCARKGQRAARAAESEGRDADAARRAAYRRARAEWDRWVAQRAMNATPVASIEDPPSERPARPAFVLPELVMPEPIHAPPPASPIVMPHAEKTAVVLPARATGPVSVPPALRLPATFCESEREAWRAVLDELASTGAAYWSEGAERKAIGRQALARGLDEGRLRAIGTRYALTTRYGVAGDRRRMGTRAQALAERGPA